MLEVAKTWQKPPLTVLAGRPDTWRDDDTLLALAYQRYRASRVGPSGWPLRLAGDAGEQDSWTVDEDTIDYAQTALNTWSKDRSHDDSLAIVPRIAYHKTIMPWER